MLFSIPRPEGKVHKGRGFSLFGSFMIVKCLDHYLAHGRDITEIS